jgi:hypothetical protein
LDDKTEILTKGVGLHTCPHRDGLLERVLSSVGMEGGMEGGIAVTQLHLLLSVVARKGSPTFVESDLGLTLIL